MPTEIQIEESKDASGLVTRTVTTGSLSGGLDPSADCRSYRKTQSDAQVTLVEEFFDETPPVFALDVSTTQEPVESHPYFAPLSQKNRQDWAMWKQNPNNPDLNGWNPSDETGEQFSTLYVLWTKGITNYFAPRIVIKCTTIEDDEPNASDVGLISDPGYGGNTGNVNFIMTGISAQQEGAKWRVTREYLGSANGSTWENVLYT